ncbi:MAG: type II toxin-antitoxin system HicB family antitoxin [Janthinobacterium lividum]
MIFEHTATGYSAYVPDLQGLAVFGETRAEAEQNAREGIAFHIDGLRLEGLPIPDPTTESATLEVAVA